MKLHKIGDKSRAICPFCDAMRSTTFRERDVPLRSGKGTVHDVLVAVCDTCDRVVGVPQQSAPRVQETVAAGRRPLEARVPRHLLDAVGLACQALGSGPDASPVLFRYYLQRFARAARLQSRLARLSASDEAQGPSGARFSAKLSDALYADLEALERSTHLKKAAVVRGLIVQMKRDILDERRADVRAELETILRVAG